jgi:cobalt transporter subunit CbtA
MIVRLLSAACLAGLLAAGVTAALQAAATTPLIVAAERFEARGPAAHAHAEVGGNPAAEAPGAPASAAPVSAAPAAGDEAWAPEGLSRAAFTGLATLVSAVGYALVLSALILASGAEMTLATALPWALGAFLAVNLAPAIGLPPELPGMGGGNLAARQAWWALTVAATGIGLYLVAAVRSRWAVLLGTIAVALPHLVGAPHLAEASPVPAGLAALFAVRSLAVALLFWLTLGAALGWIGARLSRAEPPRASG